jgi:peptidoglycan/LPS O-acetylase OafA/YrhL
MDLLAMGAWLALRDRPSEEAEGGAAGASARTPAGGDGAWMASHRAGWLAAAAAALLAFTALSLMVPSFRTRNNTVLFNVVAFSLAGVFFTSVLAYVRVSGQRWVGRVLLHPALRYLGKVSYMAYLCHMLAIDVVRDLGVAGAKGAPLSFALTLGFSTLSWYLLEQPLARLRSVVRPTAAT